MHTKHILAIATLLSATTVNAFWRMPCPSRLIDERADPIVDPGKVAGHVHSISGGNGFGFTMSYQDARRSTCSSCPIKQDLSAYWTPKLYYQSQKGTFTAVPQAGDGDGSLGGMTVYYLQRPGPNNDKLHAFPAGFRMLAGDPYKRSSSNDFATDAISYACLDYNGPATAETNSFPNRDCPDGLRVQVFFPSCWDGKNLDSPDHKSHVAYPASGAYNDGPCPASHPVHLISIFYEVIYSVHDFADKWYGDGQPFVFANGDPTGYGFHGDFVNGWDINILQQAVDNCNDDSGDTEACQYFDFFEDDECQGCKLLPAIKEDVNGPMPALPGCNPVTSGPGPAPDLSKNCKAPPIIDGGGSGQAGNGTSSEASSGFNAIFRDMTHMGWKYIGCGTDDYYDRTLTADDETSDTMTIVKCVNYCAAKGYKYAGAEYSTECYCDNTLAQDRAPKAGVLGNCNMKCGGSKRMCGGSGAMSLYEKCDDQGDCQNVDPASFGNGGLNARSLSRKRKMRA